MKIIVGLLLGMIALVALWQFMPPSGLRILMAAATGALVMYMLYRGTE